MKKFLVGLAVVSVMLAACGSSGATEVTREVVVTKEVIKEVEKKVEVVVTKEVVKEVVVTATPNVEEIVASRVAATLSAQKVEPTKVPAEATAVPADSSPVLTDTSTSTETITSASSNQFVSLNYDESNNDALTEGQTKLVASYLRIAAPISQAQLEKAVAAIQTEAAAVKATTIQSETLKLDEHQAWFVWCSDAGKVDPPADVSLPIQPSLMASNAPGRVFVQVPFAESVPLRSDNTWRGCSLFWAVAVK